jgi:hypothetical protein
MPYAIHHGRSIVRELWWKHHSHQVLGRAFVWAAVLFVWAEFIIHVLSDSGLI